LRSIKPERTGLYGFYLLHLLANLIGFGAGLLLDENQLSYALIGNTVNMASRIEGLTKEYRCDILASEETVKGFKGPLKAEKQPTLRVKGFSIPVTTYRIIECKKTVNGYRKDFRETRNETT